MHILITGASSGIGKALAISYAEKGNTLYITARNEERLEAVKNAIIKKGAKCEAFIINVTDKDKMAQLIHDIKKIDLVIANAGISTGSLSDHDASEKISRHLIDINVLGVLNTVYPAIKKMKQHGSGHIALMSSMAGFNGLGGASAYCASKAFVRVWGESLLVDLKDHNIDVTIICPGWVKSALTDKNSFKMPLLMEVDKAVNIIKSGLEKKKPIIKFPLRIYFITRFLEFLPIKISSAILHKLPKKMHKES
jgi:short-subunit dehydrogenase